jgi:DNA-directed RNA polymerase subunit beta'
MLRTTAGQVLINEVLPEDLRDYNRKLDKKGTGALFQEIAGRYPERYKEIAKKLYDVGRRGATESGGYSFGVDALRTPEKTQQLKDELRNQVEAIQTSNLSDAEKQKRVVELLRSRTKDIETHLYDEASAMKNPLAMQVMSGARGNPGNLRSVLFGDLLYENHHGQPIPIPVLRSYSQGLTPVEYWSGTFGTRKGVADLKFATQDAGFFGKQLNQATHRLVIASRDAEKPDDNIRGVPMPTNDADNEGSLLARDVGGYKRNQILTPKILADLEAKGHGRILVRSPIVGGHPDGGLYSADVGVRERGGLAAPGDNVGMAAAQALAEPVTQAQISSKHTGGVAGAGSAIAGFKYINQLVQVPKTFTGGASHAQFDGKVGAIYDAPAGGKYVMIGGQRHFVSAGLEPKVKTGDTVESGDVISDGLPNPAEIVNHKGIGEGRRYFVDVMRKVYKDSGMKSHRRNLELLSRGLINHVQLTDAMGDYVPGDTVPYDVLEHHWQPRDGHAIVPGKQAVGKYLERPVLHYSIGTKVRPSMLKDFDHFGVKHVVVHPEPPPFQPVMIRAMENLLHDPDWMTRQLGTNLRKGLLMGAHRGATSDELGTSFVPALAAAKDFGRVGKTKGWRPEQVVKTELLHPEHEQFAE